MDAARAASAAAAAAAGMGGAQLGHAGATSLHPLAEGGVPTSWQLFFPQQGFDPGGRSETLVQQLFHFLVATRDGQRLLSKHVHVSGDVAQWHCNVSRLVSAHGVPKDIVPALRNFPEEALRCLAVAASEALKSEGVDVGQLKLAVRLHSYAESVCAMKDLRAGSVGNLVTVKGTVVRISGVKPMVVAMDFVCTRCGAATRHAFADGRFAVPPACCNSNCRSRSFQQQRETAAKISFQQLRLQECVEESREEEGRVPRSVDCELTGELVDACCPGDVISVCGFVRVLNHDVAAAGGAARGKRRDQCVFHLYLHAVSIVNHATASHHHHHQRDGSSDASADRGSSMAPVMWGNRDGGGSGVSAVVGRAFSDRELNHIADCVESYSDRMFAHMVHSLCPGICGHDLVKAGLLLSLFGGVRKHVDDPDKVPVRGDIHVLVLGDPGLGKSQLLKAATAAAPRSVYVSGGGASSSGLTVAIVKDALTGDFAFEAGAMVLADQGTCCIDEFDKMGNEHQALLEAMEQQSVSVAKAGLVANLSARASVIAAANPVGGHYNRAKTIFDNVKMSPALLSRFDLVFVVLDQPDSLLDQRLSDHVMAVHTRMGFSSRMRSSSSATSLLGSVGSGATRPDVRLHNGEGDEPLAFRLRLSSEEALHFRPLPPSLLRTYIAYARQYVHPRMTRDATDVLRDFYLKLRSRTELADEGVPVTVRQLETIVRVAEARARVDLREEVTKEDAEDVVQLLSECVFARAFERGGGMGGVGGTGTDPCARSGGSSSKSKEKKRFLAAIQGMAKRSQSKFTRKEFAQVADDMGLRVPDLDALVDELNEAGLILKKGDGKFEVLI